MLRKTLFAILFCAALPARVLGADPAQVDDFWDALRLDETLEIMRAEGLDYSRTLAEGMLPTGASATWMGQVDRIYDLDEMRRHVRTSTEQVLAEEDLGRLIEFFNSDLGQEIVSLELSARRAQLDKDAEDAAKQRYRDAEAALDPRVEMVGRFIDAGELVERNVVGGLNSNYAFYTGLIDSEAEALSLTEEQAITDVWGQEGEVREDTEEWLYAFLMMAYQPLDDAELEEYIALQESDDGRILTRALFAGFDPMFQRISYALGLAIGRAMDAQDL
ncbi:hypothetical protein SAMN05421688_1822 [Poseidonocella pacifica]|uniref:DUF2059 domain-containing protein n=1 Tax=Poseidonocella pacifica TaxID=871651 RepID=A0A1I0X3J7_9RHOB|nr:DUF2059 domain-containing protein [Poseidonocella pacifica]SFA95404.1 hypothetical protein SAMN05421688_1822 [Poseidonocella pacifica]